MRARAGRSTLGCLFTLLLIVAIGYFGINIGRVYWHYFEFQDAMQQQARFASHTSDADIVTALRAQADTLGLPDAAQQVYVRRVRDSVFIWANYIETVEFPGFVRDLNLTPHAEGAF